MKDYSMSLKEGKDFILGYDITEDGQIIVKFAGGKSWTIPYNEQNEQILLDKMRNQIVKYGVIENKLKEQLKKCSMIFTISFGCGLILLLSALSGENVSYLLTGASLFGGGSILPLLPYLVINSKLKDLRKNKKFIQMEEKLNSNVRTNHNTLVGISSKTRRFIEDTPKDKEVFNINSFNYVPFRDLEQIMENVERNEKFGFDYTMTEKPKTKKKIR